MAQSVERLTLAFGSGCETEPWGPGQAPSSARTLLGVRSLALPPALLLLGARLPVPHTNPLKTPVGVLTVALFSSRVLCQVEDVPFFPLFESFFLKNFLIEIRFCQ